jgi:hypothetical protein
MQCFRADQTAVNRNLLAELVQFKRELIILITSPANDTDLQFKDVGWQVRVLVLAAHVLVLIPVADVKWHGRRTMQQLA